MRYKLIRFCTCNYFLLIKWKRDLIYKNKYMKKGI